MVKQIFALLFLFVPSITIAATTYITAPGSGISQADGWVTCKIPAEDGCLEIIIGEKKDCTIFCLTRTERIVPFRTLLAKRKPKTEYLGIQFDPHYNKVFIFYKNK